MSPLTEYYWSFHFVFVTEEWDNNVYFIWTVEWIKHLTYRQEMMIIFYIKKIWCLQPEYSKQTYTERQSYIVFVFKNLCYKHVNVFVEGQQWLILVNFYVSWFLEESVVSLAIRPLSAYLLSFYASSFSISSVTRSFLKKHY